MNGKNVHEGQDKSHFDFFLSIKQLMKGEEEWEPEDSSAQLSFDSCSYIRGSLTASNAVLQIKEEMLFDNLIILSSSVPILMGSGNDRCSIDPALRGRRRAPCLHRQRDSAKREEVFSSAKLYALCSYCVRGGLRQRPILYKISANAD